MEGEIVKIIKKFKFEELESAVMPIFPEISWDNIKSELVKYHNRFTSVNATQLIKIAITNNSINRKDLEDRLSMLKLVDISWHNNRKIWYSYLLKGSAQSKDYFLHSKVQAKLKDYFISLNLKIDVKMYMHNNITYISLNQRKHKSKKLKTGLGLPLIFAVFTGEKYFFVNRKSVSPNVLQAIAASMGYEKSKQIKLMGKDLKSLSKMCMNRKKGVQNSEKMSKIVEYNNSGPERKSTGIDFTEHKQRKRYAEECFGDDPAIIEVFVVNATSRILMDEDESTELSNETLSITCEYRSPNVAAFLTKLIEKRIITTPVPHYISNLMTLGKNEVTISNN
ncbi:uncharacterized protein LOC117219596 [Megalopta genalis]|uniref:uncharacterized protein LOC117219596 n=1 Tax=Megalopta genalis TaxID=115081 RepID=UPI00144339E7|nr:uncharacterized protein LOC117219596 [Megalopta genalis]XP_033324730.1 uncharacterized protein LOC117219596 [Megalopta genalis]XP_033324731.1 uncharacterized protein LOC117219596 [Megalopta genalis]